MLSASCADSTTQDNSNDTASSAVEQQDMPLFQSRMQLKYKQKHNQQPDSIEFVQYNKAVLQKNQGIAGFWNEVVSLEPDGIIIRDLATGEERLVVPDNCCFITLNKWNSRYEDCVVFIDKLQPGDIIQIQINALEVPENSRKTQLGDKVTYSAQELYKNNSEISFPHGNGIKIRVLNLEKYRSTPELTKQATMSYSR